MLIATCSFVSTTKGRTLGNQGYLSFCPNKTHDRCMRTRVLTPAAAAITLTALPTEITQSISHTRANTVSKSFLKSKSVQRNILIPKLFSASINSLSQSPCNKLTN